VAKYVNVKAYEKAGGATRRDLFSDDEKRVYLLDGALLERLATDKLQKKANQIAVDGWKWVEVRSRYNHDEFVKHPCGFPAFWWSCMRLPETGPTPTLNPLVDSSNLSGPTRISRRIRHLASSTTLGAFFLSCAVARFLPDARQARSQRLSACVQRQIRRL